MKFRSTLITGAVLGSLIAGFAASTHAMTPRIYGGTPATGNPGVAALAINSGSSWDRSCSAAVWKPRIILTSGHCVTVPGGTANFPGFALFPPGGVAVQYSNIGPQGASSVSVQQIFKPATYINASNNVEANDIAVLVLNSDLGPSPYARLATAAELTRWSQDLQPSTLLGYGLTGVDQRGDIPMQVQLPIDTYEPASNYGSVFSVSQDSNGGICSGDSGGPTYATNSNGQSLLLGVNSGSAGGCVAGFSGAYLMIGFVAIDYLTMLNAALTAAGYPTIPSSPQALQLQARNNSVVATWQPPIISPETVVGYDVLTASGDLACTTTTTTCTVPNLANGEHTFTVRARNSEGEGNALPATLTASVVPPGQMSPPTIVGKKIRFNTLVGRTSAVVTSYRVIDAKGKRICTLNRFKASASRLTCPLPSKAGKYRFRVYAVTEMGQSVPSGLSRLARVS